MKFSLLLLVFICSIIPAFAVETINLDGMLTAQSITKNGIGMGSIIAIVASWSRNKSILWAILHGIFGWFYVIYYAITQIGK